VYARRVGDKVLDFNHRGWLYEETFTFYDYETDSLWVQATGLAVAGAYKGTYLQRLPSVQTIWSQWKSLHPDSRVLARVLDGNSAYWKDSYESYYQTGSGIKYQRHHTLSFGMAVVLPGGQKLYPFQELEKKPVLADRVAGEPVLVVFQPASRTAVGFDPRQNGQALDFPDYHVDKTDVTLTDKQTRSSWSGLTGRCLAGPSKGAHLRQLTTTQWIVENWPLHYPKGPVYRAP
jgi:hypothetical protein